MRARFGLDERIEVRRRFNAAPGDHVLAVVCGRERPQGELLRWGLVPHWAKDPAALGNRTINARAETVAEKPAFRDAFAQRRCLILADGFYEWSEGVAHWVTRTDGEPFAFAGLWATWRPGEAPGGATGRGELGRDDGRAAAEDADVEPLRSCTIVTTRAAERLRTLHPRMPVMLERSDECAWIDPDTSVEALHELMRPFEDTAQRPVSKAVNDSRHDAPDCLAPPEQAALF